MSFGTTLLNMLAPTAEALEIQELERLEELQFKADPELAKTILVSLNAAYVNIAKLAAKSNSVFFKDLVAGVQQAIQDEATLHNIAL